MRQPIVYTPTQIRQWDVAKNFKDRWIPCRPYGHNLLPFKYRLLIAWKVFTGKYDALNWEYDQ